MLSVEAVEYATEDEALEAEVWTKAALRPRYDDEGRRPRQERKPRARKRHGRRAIADL